MNFNDTQLVQKQKLTIQNFLPEIGLEQIRHEIVTGLKNVVPRISSKYFYDKKGSELFEEITELDEYYPTRIEKSIIANIAAEQMNRNSAFEIIELGSGDCSKISIFLDVLEKSALKNVKYIPVDFSRSAIEKSANELLLRFPGLKINGYVADFNHQLSLVPHSEQPRIICFLGSTIGNFAKKEAHEMLKNLSDSLLENDSLLVGFDMKKPTEILHSAYNDSKGITERFNKNILNVVNRILEADFDLQNFNHHSFYNPEKSRIEMHLIANKNVIIHSPFFKNPLKFQKGDSIHTENSYKFSSEQISELAVGADLKIRNRFADPRNWFSLVEFQKK